MTWSLAHVNLPVLLTILQAQANAGRRFYFDPVVRRRARAHARAAATALRGLQYLGPGPEDCDQPHGPTPKWHGEGFRGHAFRSVFIQANPSERMLLVYRYLAEQGPGANLCCDIFAEVFGVRPDTIRPPLKELVRVGMIEVRRAGRLRNRLDYYISERKTSPGELPPPG